ncbi:MAG TPA: winged helix-turn-helix domain-containing protein [Candidatus Acidoferrum sp.]
MNSNFGSAAQPAMDTASPQGSANNARYVRFGPFYIDQRRQQVFRSGSRLRLQGKVYQVLMALLQKQGEVVTRDELKHALWPSDTHVNYDANVNTTVNKLRQALGESTEKPLYIETIPRKGYSFISSAEFSEQPFPAAVLVDSEQAAGSAVPGGTEDSNPPSSSKWRSIIIVGLILVGMLLGAGVATYWISHFAPQIRHSLAADTHRAPLRDAA